MAVAQRATISFLLGDSDFYFIAVNVLDSK